MMVLVLGAHGSALAQDASVPTRALDESGLHVYLWSSSPETGYVVRASTGIHGVTGANDAIRVDVKQRDRTLATRRCPIQRTSGAWGRFECEVGSDAPLTATGELTIEIHYVDDVAETTALLRTLAVNVVAYPYWVRSEGRRQIMGNSYQIDGSDLLGTAFAYMVDPGSDMTSLDGRTHDVQFYASFSGQFTWRSVMLRCDTADGVRIDRRLSIESISDSSATERLSPTAELRTVGWYRAKLESIDLWWGRPFPLPDGVDIVFLGEHPGLWSCAVRSEGQVLRTFRFVVGDDGRIVPHAEETGAGAMRMIPGLHLVDVRLPSPSPMDAAIDPAAIRRASQYGRPWSSPEGVREMLGALPPASGSIAPSRRR
jgi:hypothetical protein